MELHDFIPHIWLALATGGLALALMSLVESVSDFRATKPTNGFRALALGDIAQESIRTLLYVLFAGLGVYYLLIEQEVTRTGVGWLMVGAELLLIIKTLIQISVRRYLRGHTMKEGKR